MPSETVTAMNFRNDVNGDGVIDGEDTKLVEANAGNEFESQAPPQGTVRQVKYAYDDDGRVTNIEIPGLYNYTQT